MSRPTPALSTAPRPARRPPPLRIYQHHCDDLDDHVEGLQDWELAYEQLGRGAFEGGFTEVRLPGLQVFSERLNQPVRQRGALGPASLGFAFFEHGPAEATYNGHQVQPHQVMFCHDGELDLRTPARCELGGVVVDAALMQRRLGPLGQADLVALRSGTMATLALDSRTGLRLRQATWDLLNTALRPSPAFGTAQAAQGPAGSEAVQALGEELLQAIGDVLVATAVPDDDLGERARLELVNRASAWMLEQVQQLQAPALADVAEAVGVSPRTLAYAFQAVLDMSPMQYLRTQRFNLVRRDLRRGTALRQRETIYDVATRHGFWHFGRFSVDYRRQFGEQPSATLARSG